MPAPDMRAAFFRRALGRSALRRYAVMLTSAEDQRLDQKYDERRRRITEAMIVHHLTGEISLAAVAAVNGRACLLSLDIDAGGFEATRALIAETYQRELWGFGQHCPRPGLADSDRRGCVRLVFDQIGGEESHFQIRAGHKALLLESKPHPPQ